MDIDRVRVDVDVDLREAGMEKKSAVVGVKDQLLSWTRVKNSVETLEMR